MRQNIISQYMYVGQYTRDGMTWVSICGVYICKYVGTRRVIFATCSGRDAVLQIVYTRLYPVLYDYPTTSAYGKVGQSRICTLGICRQEIQAQPPEVSTGICLRSVITLIPPLCVCVCVRFVSEAITDIITSSPYRKGSGRTSKEVKLDILYLFTLPAIYIYIYIYQQH